MFNGSRQTRRGGSRARLVVALLLLATHAGYASAQGRGDADLPPALAESLREAGVIDAPAPSPPAAKPAPAPAAPAPMPAAAPKAEELPRLPAEAPAAVPAPAPVAAPAPAEMKASAETDLDLPPLPADSAAPAESKPPVATPLPAAPVATPSPATQPVAPDPSTPAAEAPAAAPATAGETMPTSPAQMFAAPTDEGFTQASCASCGRSVRADVNGYGRCNSCGRAGQCVPGRKNCGGVGGCDQHFMCRFIGNLYECLCCPDPCYQPSWVPEANAAFFQDYARPRTLTRFRWDHGWQMRYPDRNEFFWARQATSGGGGRGPAFPPKGYSTAKNGYGQAGVNFDQLYMYQEAASPVGSAFVEFGYRSNNPALGGSMSGFSDMNFGTKALLFDTELLQITFQFKTFMPIGQTGKGLGTGHVSLEPSLLMALRLGPESYLQAQFAEWIPLGGDPTYSGALMHYHLSLNQVLARPMPDTPIIGTLEFNGWSFQDGAFTSPSYAAPQHSGGYSYLNLGPGLRASVCDKIDFGGAVAFPLNGAYWANPLLRLELRILY